VTLPALALFQKFFGQNRPGNVVWMKHEAQLDALFPDALFPDALFPDALFRMAGCGLC